MKKEKKVSTCEKNLEECCEACLKHKVTCPVKQCRYWIKFRKDLNCTLIAARNGPLTLHETAERLGLTYGRVHQLEKLALKKLKQKNVA